MNEFANIMNAERARTGNYGADYDEWGEKIRRCPCCNAKSPDYVYEDKDGDIIGCSECLRQKDIYSDYDEEQWERKC